MLIRDSGRRWSHKGLPVIGLHILPRWKNDEWVRYSMDGSDTPVKSGLDSWILLMKGIVTWMYH